MGGLPWWLLKYDDIKLRTRDPRYLDAAKRYMKEVGRVLGPMQITRGGPILMVQVENEYGFWAKTSSTWVHCGKRCWMPVSPCRCLNATRHIISRMVSFRSFSSRQFRN